MTWARALEMWDDGPQKWVGRSDFERRVLILYGS